MIQEEDVRCVNHHQKMMRKIKKHQKKKKSK